MPEAWLSTTAGFQVPETPFVDVEGKVGAVAPAQMDRLLPNTKVGVTVGVTLTTKEIAIAH